MNAPLSLTVAEPASPRAPLLSVRNISVSYEGTRSGFWARPMPVKAIDNVSFDVFPGETLGLVGESGSGKSTTGRAILRRIGVTAGKIIFKGEDITTVSGEALRKLRRHMQIVFQDPYASLNPRMKVVDIVAEPLIVHGLVRNAEEARAEIGELLRVVGLPRDAQDRFPHAFSGGQRQRIGIARALALKPDFIVADEPVSALDVSIRAQVVNLLQDLQRDLGLTLLFIAHDLSVVRHISHRVAILYGGRLVELASRDAIYDSPLHPYTEALLSAVPVPDPKVQKARKRLVYRGDIVDAGHWPSGCNLHGRCPHATEKCSLESPPLQEKRPGHWAACWHR